MNFRTTGILFGLVFAFALILLGMSLFESDAKTSDLILEKLVLAGVKESDVDTVEIERDGGGKIKLVRSGTEWKMTEPIQVKADSHQVDSLLTALFKARPIKYDGLSSSKATHGLDPAGLKITIRKGDTSETVSLGEVLSSSRTAVAFVTTGSRPDRPMAIPREGIDPLLKDSRGGGSSKDLAKWENEYRVKTVFSVPSQLVGENVQSLTMVGRGDDLTLTRNSEGWRLSAHFKSRTLVNGKEETQPRALDNVDADPSGDTGPTAPTNTFNGVQPFLMALTNLQAVNSEDFLPDDAAKLAEYGLADNSPDRITVEMKAKGAAGQTDIVEKVFIGKKVDGQPNRVYVKVPGTPGIFRASTSNLDGIFGVLADPAPMRNRNLLPSDIKSTFVAVDITKGSHTTRLRQAGSPFGQWKIYGEPDDPTDANAAAISKMLELINQKRIVKDFPTLNDANFAGPELKVELKLWSELEAPTDPKLAADAKYEPRPKGAPVTLQFGKVTRDATGKVTEVWVRRTLPSGAKADFILPGEVKTAPSFMPPGGQFQPPPSAGTDTDVLATVDKSRLDLLSTELKGFSPTPGVVTKLTIAQMGQPTLEASHDDKPDPPYYPTGKWSYFHYPAGQPAARTPIFSADPNEVYALMSTLSTLSASAFDLERPSEAQRAERGLSTTNPVMKVTVTLKTNTAPPVALPGMPPPPPPAPEERIYYFGKDVARHGKTYVYAMQEGRNVVFLVDKSILTRLASADVRDRIVIRFDPAKVRRISVFGWADKNPGPVPLLAFDKNAQGNWVYSPFPPGQVITGIPMQSPALTLDPGKVNSFLYALNGLRAESFLPRESLSRGEYGFAPNQRGLGVVIEVEGAARPIQLNIAAGVKMDPDGKTIREFVVPEQAERFVVVSDTAEDPSVNPFTVSAAALKPFKENFTAFGVR